MVTEPTKGQFHFGQEIENWQRGSTVRRVLQIGWMIVRGIAELAIMVYVLSAISEPNINLIVAVLGIIYATVRSAALYLRLTISGLAWASDRQFLEHKRVWADPTANIDIEIAGTDASRSRMLVNFYIGELSRSMLK